ncbi:hypothetical protein WBJ53_17700 [Spirosoma sp. SC4-14]|uniref:hypothetical protein n=1 Tax=Spirosoma sp. SC4-14 TaxID=3128900 RepID=UPI0030CD4296
MRTLTGQPALAFHSILEHDVIERNVFDSYYEAKEMLGRYFSHYNRQAALHHRLHRSIGFITAPAARTPAEMGRSTGNLRHNSSGCRLFRKFVQLIGG